LTDLRAARDGDRIMRVLTVIPGKAGTAAAKPDWLEALTSRRVPLDRWQDALARQPEDVKVVLEIAA